MFEIIPPPICVREESVQHERIPELRLLFKEYGTKNHGSPVETEHECQL
jgi:hypothetical protein